MVIGALLVIVLVGCGGGSAGPDGGRQVDGRPTGEITVSAAASLTEAFTEIAGDFSDANPGATVRLNFDSSGSLSEQIQRGAPVDVFASANQEKMADLVAADAVRGSPELFAANALAIVTKPGNPEGIETLADLPGSGTIALCGEDAPCGSLAAQVLDRAGVVIPVDSVTRGQNVKATLTAVTEGDAAAAIVYVTDASTAGSRVTTMAIPESENDETSYPIASLADGSNPDLADAFIAYVRSAEGQAVLADFGFLPPA